MPVADRPALTTDAQRERSRLLFLKALMEIEKSGFGGLSVDGNPIQLLREQVWPKWREVMHHPPRSGVKQYLDPPRNRRRNYIEFLAEQEQEATALDELFDRWANDCRLMELDDAGKTRPAQWVIAYARQICWAWSRTELGEDKPLSWTARLSGQEDREHLQSAGAEARPPAAPTSLTFPMEPAIPEEGESWRGYTRRARRSLNAYLRILEHTQTLGTPAPITIGSTGAARTRVRKLDGMDHFRWLVLFQCCEWPLKKIEAASLRTPQAIWQGIAEKAKLVGIKIRAKALKKNS